MKNLQLLLLFFFLFSCHNTFAFSKRMDDSKTMLEIKFSGDTIPHDSILVSLNNDTTPKAHGKENVKLIAAILAFPVPFGALGLHRIYLGTEPWVPVVYIITFGGGFGLLPTIDFFEIIFSSNEELESYKNNSKIFMWVK